MGLGSVASFNASNTFADTIEESTNAGNAEGDTNAGNAGGDANAGNAGGDANAGNAGGDAEMQKEMLMQEMQKKMLMQEMQKKMLMQEMQKEMLMQEMQKKILMQEMQGNLVKFFFVPMLTLLITVPVALIVIGPIATFGSTLISQIVISIRDFGMHWGFIPVYINNVMTLGYDNVMMPFFACTFASSAVVLAIFFKTNISINEIDKKRFKLDDLSKKIWENPEKAFKEFKACENTANFLRASFGSGKPVIGFMGEFDALPGLNQKVSTKQEAFELGAYGHAVNSVKFHFKGKTAHAGSDPQNGRSALDAVELTNVGANYLREHVTSDVRIHYTITDGGVQFLIKHQYGIIQEL
ncbi:putative aminobenzoyl-glutamate utilization domain protein [Clostridioides difficile DA00126]|nr:putative aminobenzoyl-glutamate utilization domain protein [Clostridioides difficile DA00126]